jgi:DNA-binding transcriptional ArsR family regulator
VECLHPEHVAPLLGRVIDYAAADEVASTFAVLADPTRSRILHALSLADELCVCDLALLLAISQSALSHQLRLLRDRRVVARRKAGRIVYYRLADKHVRNLFSDGLRHATEVSALERRSTVA